jgi:hypothetical protein
MAFDEIELESAAKRAKSKMPWQEDVHTESDDDEASLAEGSGLDSKIVFTLKV